MKTFKIRLDERTTREVEQLATFTADVQGEQFRFVVTLDSGIVSLTHRESTKRVAKIERASIQAALGDYALAGEAALNALIDKLGAARVRSVLAAAS